jgi:hypothetical protein
MLLFVFLCWGFVLGGGVHNCLFGEMGGSIIDGDADIERFFEFYEVAIVNAFECYL